MRKHNSLSYPIYSGACFQENKRVHLFWLKNAGSMSAMRMTCDQSLPHTRINTAYVLTTLVVYGLWLENTKVATLYSNAVLSTREMII